MKRTYYQIQSTLDGKERRFCDKYANKEDAMRVAVKMANSMKFGKIEVLTLTEEITATEEIKPTPLYKALW